MYNSHYFAENVFLYLEALKQRGVLGVQMHQKASDSKYLPSFTPTQDLKLLWTKHYYPHSSWQEIAEILRIQFAIDLPPHVLRHRFEEYLLVPELKVASYQQEARERGLDFLQGQRKKPEQFLELYKEIKKYHERSTLTKREQTYEKDIIKRELYPDFEANLARFQQQAAGVMAIGNVEQLFDLLRYKPTEELTEEQAVVLEKIEKIKFKVKQLRLENQRKISKLYRIIRTIIQVESRHFSQEILVNEINVNKYFVKILKNIYKNVEKVALTIERAPAVQEGSRSLSNLFLQSSDNIELAYAEDPHKPFRKEIIKLYYFPNAEKNRLRERLFETPDGEKISEKRLLIILKMFRKIQNNFLKNKLKTENQIIAEITGIEKEQFDQQKGQLDQQSNSNTTKTVKNTMNSPFEKRHLTRVKETSCERVAVQQRKPAFAMDSVEGSEVSQIRPVGPMARRGHQQSIRSNSRRQQEERKLSPIYRLDEDLDEEEASEPIRYPHPLPSEEPSTAVLMYGEPKYLARGQPKEQYRQICRRVNRKKKEREAKKNHLPSENNQSFVDEKPAPSSKYSIADGYKSTVTAKPPKQPQKPINTEEVVFQSPFESPFDDDDDVKVEKKKRGRKPKQKNIEEYLSQSVLAKDESQKEVQSKGKETVRTVRKKKAEAEPANTPLSRLQSMINEQIMDASKYNSTKSSQNLLGFLSKYK